MDECSRPWGKYEILLSEKNYKVKKISVIPGGSLSYQYHLKRAEDWVIVQGKGRVTVDDNTFELEVGDSIHIPTLAKHRIQNTADCELVFIEVQTGEYFGEDDIVRLEDSYGRV